ncbi:TPA: hypothetical protein ACNIQM_002914 [Citrobacter werkmanii]
MPDDILLLLFFYFQRQPRCGDGRIQTLNEEKLIVIVGILAMIIPPVIRWLTH